MSDRRPILTLFLLLLLPVCASIGAGRTTAATGDDDDGGDGDAVAAVIDDEVLAARLSPRHQSFLSDVAPLITELEREVFLELRQEYQREQFIRRFWRVRDPFPQTGRNELREAWEARLVLARERWQDMTLDRPRLFLLLGEPTRVAHVHCPEVLRPVEIWTYAQGTDRIRGAFTLLFVGQQPRGRGRHRLWYPGQGLSPLLTLGATSLGIDQNRIARAIEERCTRGDEVLAGLAQSLDLQHAEHRLLPPPPSEEWVRSLRARSTDLPEDAAPLEASLGWSFPGRHQSRTVVQGLVSVPADAAGLLERGGYRGHGFVVDGEVLRGDELFEQFRYRFDLPAGGPGKTEAAPAEIPLVVQRYLRPGTYTVILKVEDLASRRYFREEGRITVPRVDRRRPPRAIVDGKAVIAPAHDPRVEGAMTGDVMAGGVMTGDVMTGDVMTGDVMAGDVMASGLMAKGAVTGTPNGLAPNVTRTKGTMAEGVATAGDDVTLTTPTLLGGRLDEANAAIATGDHSIRLERPSGVLAVGKIRVLARTRGEGIARVSFELDGKPVLKKTRPPYSVEIDLGDKPRLHDLRAVALDAENRVLASDEIVVNAGPHRFSVRLIEPQPGRRYRQSVRVRAAVEVPEGERLDRLEMYLDDTLLATLYQPPFEQPVLLQDGGEELSWIRVVAHLRDGASAEDTVFINAPDYVDEVDVSMVELYTTVIDRKKNFAEDLEASDFRVFEDGKEQRISRFELVRDLPIYAGIVLDTSLSMVEELREVEKAAYNFLETVLQPRDRAAVITFNDAPTLRVRFTGDKSILAGGLTELVAEGETALYDTIIFALHYFSGLRGKRAVVVLTDGADSNSSYSYADALEFAHHTGVALYIIALDLPTQAAEISMLMRRLANETGGGFYAVQHAGQVEKVYRTIQEELRSQYLLAYQSSRSDGDGFRRVEIEVKEKGLQAKTISGYFP